MMWSIPDFEFLMRGEGHKDWISDCDFHPSGTHLITASGDGTVKLWDFEESVCVASYSDHSQVRLQTIRKMLKVSRLYWRYCRPKGSYYTIVLSSNTTSISFQCQFYFKSNCSCF